MDARVPAVAEQLLLIERELRLLSLWAETPPAPEALASEQPFCVDTLSFEQWLQWIFLPRMKSIIEESHPLPAVSGIRAMGEVVYRERMAEASSLLGALGDFDRLLGA
ncbi:YqcC family protein [Stutzerimonas kirkiae]|uniref:Pseudouridine synthase n=1 Tax=Stutzerimonas kirkiae TaxID=2211392 RepID=A0A4Q9R7X7_9GAMM|nr:YqcC family protein [Stutzerimonas kirkiae]TBU95798.1 pseudouridine synthase [Stutzerimonas kirkiae]TBV02789.1 pseudouridine synthase [Stutzerimonas kirkiae]TBV03717.1 pseudouridine synthase [Stutzerimonas kirkiae]